MSVTQLIYLSRTWDIFIFAPSFNSFERSLNPVGGYINAVFTVDIADVNPLNPIDVFFIGSSLEFISGITSNNILAKSDACSNALAYSLVLNE